MARSAAYRFLRELNRFALLLLIAAGASLLLLPRSDDGLLGMPALGVGEPAPRTIKSPRTFAIPDPDTTKRLREEARERVRPTYDLLIGRGKDAKVRLEVAFSAAAPEGEVDEVALKESEQNRAADFMLALGVTLKDKTLLPLIRGPQFDELRDAAIMVAKAIYEHRIVEDKALLTLVAPSGIQVRMIDAQGRIDREENIFNYSKIIGLDTARSRVDELVAARLARLSLEQRRSIAVLVKRLLKPNIIANNTESLARKRTAERSVKTVVIPIKRGETVLRAGGRVTERHLFILKEMERELKAESRVQAAAGSALLMILVVILGYLLVQRSSQRFVPSQRDLAFLATTYIAVLLIMWTGYKSVLWLTESFPLISLPAYRYALPVAAGVMLVRFAVGVEAAAAFAPVVALTVGWMMDVSLGFTAYALMGALAAASAPKRDRSWASIFRTAIRVTFVQSVSVLALALLASRISLEETSIEVLGALVSGLLSVLLVSLLLPAVEVIFGYTTTLKLNDLANLNHPLLRDLLVEAPGTYHHSIMVARLAEAAAERIGADALMARVGAYYHDIGKLKNPQAFSENEKGSFINMPPVEEAKELKMHVADGLELAAKHRLGDRILEIIAQHHGVAEVRKPYQRARELKSDASEFRYPGPKPLSREAALVMLADVVEAATRELLEQPGVERSAIVERVRQLVGEVLEQGQLDRCDLMLRDMSEIARAFTEVLEGRLSKRNRGATASLPGVPLAAIVRPPPGGEPN